MIESEVQLIPLDRILCERNKRQRSEIDDAKVVDLASSIAKQGLIHPILIQRSGELIAGEHRLLAFKHNAFYQIPCSHADYQNWTHIPAHFAFDVTAREVHILELEENIRRVNLDWRDEARAIAKYHTTRIEQDADWTYESTANALGCSHQHVGRCIAVASEIESPKLAAASSVRSAADIIERHNQRAINAELDSLLEVEKPNAESVEVLIQDSIINASFHDFNYSGPKINLLHCDFPYGINFNAGSQSKSEALGLYDDSPDVYWQLISSLDKFTQRFCSPSCHMLFWFSMNHYESTVSLLRRCGWTVDPFPVIWHKTDNKGILPDPERGPRRVYETALLCSRGDRKIVRAVSNTYGAPTSKQIHPSEKPESVLRHFFQMFVDEYTVLFDPTAGSGSALRAAEALGAKHTSGLELDPEFCALANGELNKARRLRSLSQ